MRVLTESLRTCVSSWVSEYWILTEYSVPSSLHRLLNNHSHLGLHSPSNPHEGRWDQLPTSGPNESETSPYYSAPRTELWCSAVEDVLDFMGQVHLAKTLKHWLYGRKGRWYMSIKMLECHVQVFRWNLCSVTATNMWQTMLSAFINRICFVNSSAFPSACLIRSCNESNILSINSAKTFRLICQWIK